MTVPTAPRLVAVSEPGSRPEAEALVDGMLATIERMDEVLREETRLVRAAKLGEAAALGEAKSAAAGSYQRELDAVRAAAGVIARLVPNRAEALRQRMAALQETLQLNLAVLGTAKAVAEDMMRAVADDVARHRTPQTYGAQGSVAGRAAGAPLSVSRRS